MVCRIKKISKVTLNKLMAFFLIMCIQYDVKMQKPWEFPEDFWSQIGSTFGVRSSFTFKNSLVAFAFLFCFRVTLVYFVPSPACDGLEGRLGY